MDSLSAWHIWLILGFVFGAAEIKLSGFVTLWFAVGAFLAAAAAGVGLGVAGQLVVFVLASVALFAASRTLFQAWFMRGAPHIKVGAEAMLGMEATVTEALPDSGSGAVRINGELWQARSIDGPISVGEAVTVESVDGLKLKVRRRTAADAPIVVHTQGD
jgi:membrane protein implicated in regulation of membrane protease activity